MINQEFSKIGKRGIVTIPASMRKRLSLEEGSLLLFEETADGVLMRPAYTVPVEIYTDKQIAEFDAEEERLGEVLKRFQK